MIEDKENATDKENEKMKIIMTQMKATVEEKVEDDKYDRQERQNQFK